MDNQRKTDLGLKLLDNVQSLIKFFDTKVNVLLVISGVTTTFVLASFRDFDGIDFCSKITLCLFFFSFVLFVVLSILTISPRSDKYTGNSVSKTIYFAHIASRIEVKDFIKDYNNLDERAFQDDILYQLFENSKIANRKVKLYKMSLVAIEFQLFFFFSLIIINYMIA